MRPWRSSAEHAGAVSARSAQSGRCGAIRAGNRRLRNRRAGMSSPRGSSPGRGSSASSRGSASSARSRSWRPTRARGSAGRRAGARHGAPRGGRTSRRRAPAGNGAGVDRGTRVRWRSSADEGGVGASRRDRPGPLRALRRADPRMGAVGSRPSRSRPQRLHRPGASALQQGDRGPATRAAVDRRAEGNRVREAVRARHGAPRARARRARAPGGRAPSADAAGLLSEVQ